MPLHRMMLGAYSFSVFHTCIRGYMRTNVRPSVRMCVHRYVRDPVRLGLRHLYQVEFCSFIVRYPTAGASVYCGHISSLFFFQNFVILFCSFKLLQFIPKLGSMAVFALILNQE